MVLQRVESACVHVVETGELAGKIGRGILCLLGMGVEDQWEDADYCIRKCLKAKLWDDLNDPSKTWASSVVDRDYEVLVVSQFTLMGHLKKGTKPDFHAAMGPEQARTMFEKIVAEMRRQHKAEKIQTGKFQNYMRVELANDGPVTIIVDSSQAQLPKIKERKLPAVKAAPDPASSVSPSSPSANGDGKGDNAPGSGGQGCLKETAESARKREDVQSGQDEAKARA
ncbi:D-tyrosyl-tRNA(Tyr) deacylase,related [Neospora caninum Liverpool]|uniref:D-aminoacyl-tRNA deacylase n=1 Tax=Neospora caninum (strain Liverpool) TaxID=572307 RepID=F0VPT5_NEOCL|nr:D-tyrosyl-tRNA(Tyr) deacylase,related [Neospora caninum Liverpool]CBZ55732.1 D-tyrosyl-tRNA(Tyr) deacylase,related [Neospora caninum Liverpool]CEL70474.1 TPA: D-tyrosyl-tRNA(Tyr) deacylase, related [Neospora caninum Liverpool]|eukprot:XP_003885758.1 D-tyrosyl-tRNA(Tyr) deacylase,related [Neospora caninum Liverpool]